MFRICNHLKTPLKFIKNIHGDMIYTAGGKRSIWVCTNCGKTILMDEPFYMGEVSDGYHTFNELYHHRVVLFSVICNSNPELAWKSKLHHDGTMYDGMFIVGIETPDGQATYHYDIDPYWEMFSVQELPKAPEWDGHTPAQAIERIKRLTEPESKPLTLGELREELGRLEGLALTQNGDAEETYTNGYRWGHRNGQIELLRRILNIGDGTCESKCHKPERSEG